MDTEASTTVSTADTSTKTSTEPVKIKTEVFDPDYKSAQDAFSATAKILASAIKSEAFIKKEIKKEEPRDSSESGNPVTKMPLPIPVLTFPKKDEQKTEDRQTPVNRAHLRIVGKTKKGIKQRTLIHEAGKKQRTMVFERAPASNSGYYPPASVIWQRVPYLQPKYTKQKYNLYKWKAPKNKSKHAARRDSPQSNTDHSMNQSFLDNEQNSPSDDNDNENPPSNSTETSCKSFFFLNITEFPRTWNEEQIKEFLEKECGPVTQFEMLKDADSNFIGDIQIEFDTFEKRKEAQEKLNGKIVEGKTLSAEINDSDDDNSESGSEYSEPKKKRSKLKLDPAYRPDVDVWEKDPKGLYGLKPEFLQTLGITPPIDRWVQVTNFRCDKSELKEVMELAGQVLLCTVLTMNHKTAKVMYSHPLEAVQAVSMLNNQNFYGQSLKVTIEHCLERQIILPKGLQAVGPGLGKNGVTLRDIVRHYERYAKGRSSSINSNIFREINFKTDPFDQSASADIESVLIKTEPKAENSNSVGPFVPNPCNPMVNPSGLKAGTSGSIPGPSIPMAGPSGPMPRPIGSMPGPSGPMPGPSGPMPGPSGPMLGPSGPMSGPSGPMPRPSGPMPGPSGPMHGSIGPRSVNGGPMHNQMGPNVPGPMPHQTAGFGPNPMQPPMMMGQGSRIPRQTGPMHGPMGPVPGHFQRPGPPGPFPIQTHSNVSGPMQNQPGWFPNQPQQRMSGSGPPGPMGHRPMNNVPAMTMNNRPGPIPQSQENCTVEISNIPSNTTFTFLADKLSTCGRMMSLQLTCDRAVAQFATRGHAENCYKQFNKLKVNDNILQVKFV